MYKKVLLTFVLASLLLPILPSVSTAQANGTTIKVEPDTVTLGPEPAVGQQFTIDITMYDVADLYGWEVKLTWDNSLLNCTAEEYPILPPGLNWEAPNSLLLGPGIQQDYNETHGRWYHGLSALPMSPPVPEPFTGTIKLVTLTFEVLSQPPKGGACVLDLFDSKVSDSNAVSIDHQALDGLYEILSPGVPMPKITLDPESRNTFTGGVFDVDIVISNVNTSARLIGVDVHVGFNATMLSVVSITEGPFMKDPAWALYEPQPTIFMPNSYAGYAGFGILLVPPGGVYPYTAFPEGSGTLATITFNATAPGSCALQLSGTNGHGNNTKLSDDEGMSIEHKTVDGSVTVMEGAASPDVNGDGVVDVFDIVTAAMAFGADAENPRWNPVPDLNFDGIIDIYDLVLIALNFGTYT